MDCYDFNHYGNWELRKKLGSGGFGEVNYWMNKKTQLEIATKSLKVNNNMGPDEEQKLKERWLMEFNFMRNLNTDSIVRGIELSDKRFVAYLNERHAWKPLPVLVMEYCNGGDLRTQLQQFHNLNGLIEYEIREILRSLRKAVDYMHNVCNIQHRDLKPDNIVIHHIGNGKKIYKLTDFGFARYINDKTLLQSVVGTRNYLAPEIADSAMYTKTVDYWSVGVIAFELLCGVLPFLPHQSMFHMITSIKKKKKDCIAITEAVKEKKFINHSSIFLENRVSSNFRSRIEKWLCLALDVDHRTRGTALSGILELPNVNGGRRLKFYEELDALLQTSILTIFNLNTYTFHDFEVTNETSLKTLLDLIHETTNIPAERQLFILPLTHPIKYWKNAGMAKDFYVEEWLDTNNSLNPPVMLFITDTKYYFNVGSPIISDNVKLCMSSIYDDRDELPIWLAERFAAQIHFLLNNEQKHLQALMLGMQAYALTVEHEIWRFEEEIQNLLLKANFVKGNVAQFYLMIQNTKHSYDNALFSNEQFFQSWLAKGSNIEKDMNILERDVIPNLINRHRSALKNIQRQAKDTIPDEIIKSDIYKISEFRHHLQSAHQSNNSKPLLNVSACDVCRQTVYSCIDTRSKFLSRKEVENGLKNISNLLEEFFSIRNITEGSKNFLNKKYEDLQAWTKNFIQDLTGLVKNPTLKNGLLQSGMAHDGNENTSNINSFGASLNDLMGMSTAVLTQNSDSLCQQLMDVMNLSEDDIPTTLSQI